MREDLRRDIATAGWSVEASLGNAQVVIQDAIQEAIQAISENQNATLVAMQADREAAQSAISADNTLTATVRSYGSTGTAEKTKLTAQAEPTASRSHERTPSGTDPGWPIGHHAELPCPDKASERT